MFPAVIDGGWDAFWLDFFGDNLSVGEELLLDGLRIGLGFDIL